MNFICVLNVLEEKKVNHHISASVEEQMLENNPTPAVKAFSGTGELGPETTPGSNSGHRKT